MRPAALHNLENFSNWEKEKDITIQEAIIEFIFINIYIFTCVCMFHGSISMSQRQQDVEQVINTQIYTVFKV